MLRLGKHLTTPIPISVFRQQFYRSPLPTDTPLSNCVDGERGQGGHEMKFGCRTENVHFNLEHLEINIGCGMGWESIWGTLVISILSSSVKVPMNIFFKISILVVQ
ncbi:hypothetical protein CEXT_66141 [Caerostris extrusa]|uniref:Uncharacterized protein n=1 Tax=Caerostris extrusa TaxID=172846 RepID=A0AAV4TZT3_CAEEX|nr:hypothetical protein CEXT_66141 [Caerostris extrusa]